MDGAQQEKVPVVRQEFRFGGHHLDVTARRLTRNGETVALAPRLFDLLVALARAGDRAVSRTELIDAVWGETIVEEGNLAWTIKELRRALSDDASAIETVRGYGYRFVTHPPQQEPQQETPPDLPRAQPSRHPWWSGSPRVKWATAAALVLAFLVAFAVWPNRPETIVENRPAGSLDRLTQGSEVAPALAHEVLALEALAAGADLRARDHARRAVELSEQLEAADRLRLAGRAAALASDWLAAQVAFEQLVVARPEDLEAGLLLAEAHSRVGALGDSEAELDRLAAMPGSAGSDPRIELERGWNAWRGGDPRAARSSAERALSLARRGDQPRDLVGALILLATAERALGATESGLVHCQEAVSRARTAGLGELELAAGITCGWLALGSGGGDEARTWFAENLDLARQRGSRSHTAAALNGLATISLADGQLAATLPLAYEAVGVARDIGDVEHEASALRLLSLAARLSADLDAAERWAREGLERARTLPLAGRLVLLSGEVGRVLLERGDAPGAAAAFAEAARAEVAPSEASRALAQVSLGWARFVAGDAEGALALGNGVLQRGDALAPAVAVEAWALVAEAAAVAGDREEAGRAAEWLARVPPGRITLDAGWILALARAEATLGESDSAGARLTDLLTDPALRELLLVRLEAELRLAELNGDELAAAVARERARELGIGRLSGPG